MAKWLIGTIVYTRDGKEVLRGMVTAIIEGQVYCDWPEIGVFRSREDERDLHSTPPTPRRPQRY